MKGLLKSKSAGSQFVLLTGIALTSFFILGLAGTLILSAVTGIPVLEFSDMSKLDYNKPGIITFLRGMQVIQFISLFIVPVFISANLFSTDVKKYLGLKAPKNIEYFIAGIIVLLVSLPLVTFLGELNRNIHFPSNIEKWMKSSEDEASRTVQALLSHRSIKDLLINIICIAGLAAVGEELLFRGIAQRLLIKMFKNPWIGIIISAILFSAMHMQFYGFIPRFVLGVLLGLIFWYSGSLWTAIAAHFIYDASLIVLAYFNPSIIADDTNLKLSNIALMAAVSFVFVVFIITWMKKKSAVSYSELYADDEIPLKDHPF